MVETLKTVVASERDMAGIEWAGAGGDFMEWWVLGGGLGSMGTCICQKS